MNKLFLSALFSLPALCFAGSKPAIEDLYKAILLHDEDATEKAIDAVEKQPIPTGPMESVFLENRKYTLAAALQMEVSRGSRCSEKILKRLLKANATYDFVNYANVFSALQCMNFVAVFYPTIPDADKNSSIFIVADAVAIAYTAAEAKYALGLNSKDMNRGIVLMTEASTELMILGNAYKATYPEAKRLCNKNQACVAVMRYDEFIKDLKTHAAKLKADIKKVDKNNVDLKKNLERFYNMFFMPFLNEQNPEVDKI
jgi:hypothetical protein